MYCKNDIDIKIRDTPSMPTDGCKELDEILVHVTAVILAVLRSLYPAKIANHGL